MASAELKRFGRYEVLAELGRGAMGVVYKAHDPQIDRLVAVKTVSLGGEEPEAEQEFRRRFLNEAQAAGRLHHPGIVAVFDVGEDPETHDPYIVLEYVAGESLNKVLAREKKLALDRALQIAEEIAEALDYAHAQGVTHRDIKPANILITEDGHAKIADFGIAKLNLAHFTLPGRVLGTPAYMAPEQLTGEGVDGRSDIFSLGVILYAMVTAHSPFHGDSATTVCFKVANREPVAASVLDMKLPRELDAVIARAMAKDPKQRYQCGAEFAADLRQLKAGGTLSGSTTSFLAKSEAVARQTHSQAARATSGYGASRSAHSFSAAWRNIAVRDLLLAVATILLLVIVGAKSGLLHLPGDRPADIRSQISQIQPAPATPAQTPSSAQPSVTEAADRGSEISAAIAAPSKPARPSLRKASARASARSSAGSTSGAKNATPNPPKETIVPLAMVELSVRHQFKEATLTVWVDDQLTLTRPLRGGTQKKLVVFSQVRGVDSETLKIPAGKHMLRLRAQTADQAVDLSKTISVELVGGDDKTLLMTFDKRNTSMNLEWR